VVLFRQNSSTTVEIAAEFFVIHINRIVGLVFGEDELLVIEDYRKPFINRKHLNTCDATGD